jgi:hypothetical protein
MPVPGFGEAQVGFSSGRKPALSVDGFSRWTGSYHTNAVEMSTSSNFQAILLLPRSLG